MVEDVFWRSFGAGLDTKKGETVHTNYDTLECEETKQTWTGSHSVQSVGWRLMTSTTGLRTARRRASWSRAGKLADS